MSGAKQPEYMKWLPKISDIIMHPPSVYQALTGVYDDDKTEDDVLEKLKSAISVRFGDFK